MWHTDNKVVLLAATPQSCPLHTLRKDTESYQHFALTSNTRTQQLKELRNGEENNKASCAASAQPRKYRCRMQNLLFTWTQKLVHVEIIKKGSECFQRFLHCFNWGVSLVIHLKSCAAAETTMFETTPSSSGQKESYNCTRCHKNLLHSCCSLHLIGVQRTAATPGEVAVVLRLQRNSFFIRKSISSQSCIQIQK